VFWKRVFYLFLFVITPFSFDPRLPLTYRFHNSFSANVWNRPLKRMLQHDFTFCHWMELNSQLYTPTAFHMAEIRVADLLGCLMQSRMWLKLVTNRKFLDLHKSNPCRTWHGCVWNIMLVIMSKDVVIQFRVSMPRIPATLLIVLCNKLGRESLREDMTCVGVRMCT
jgi:hypothetical protein